MKISEILAKKDNGVCFEFFPPKSTKSKNSFLETLKALRVYNPLYVSLTCGAGGGVQDKTKEAVELFLKEKDLVVMPHMTCIGASQNKLAELLRHYQSQGIENIMALRGDPSQASGNFDTSQKDFSHAIDLVKFIKQRGDFCLGVAVYPEGHIESKSLKEDLDYTKQKIDAGADFAVTQMFFDNAYFYSFLEKIKKRGVTIPILPGILPLTNIAKVKEFVCICRATIPRQIEEKMEDSAAKPEEMEKIGIDFTISQCRDLKKNGFMRLHFFTLNRPKIMKAILEAI